MLRNKKSSGPILEAKLNSRPPSIVRVLEMEAFAQRPRLGRLITRRPVDVLTVRCVLADVHSSALRVLISFSSMMRPWRKPETLKPSPTCLVNCSPYLHS